MITWFLVLLSLSSQTKISPQHGMIKQQVNPTVSASFSRTTIYAALINIARKAKLNFKIDEYIASQVKREVCTLNFNHVSLADVVNSLSLTSRSRFTFHISKQTIFIEAPLVTISLSKMRIADALKTVFQQQDVNYICVTRQRSPKLFNFEFQAKPFQQVIREISSHDPRVSLSLSNGVYIIKESHINVSADTINTKFDFNFIDMEFDRVIQAFFKAIGASYVLLVFDNKKNSVRCEGQNFDAAFFSIIRSFQAPLVWYEQNHVWILTYPDEDMADWNELHLDHSAPNVIP